ncbi:hypothetical protein VPH35_053046 [Triticum aestivum]
MPESTLYRCAAIALPSRAGSSTPQPRPFNLAAVGVPRSNSIACASLVKQYDLRNHGGLRTSNSAVQLGVLRVIVSPMFAGKTTVLLRWHRQEDESLVRYVQVGIDAPANSFDLLGKCPLLTPFEVFQF